MNCDVFADAVKEKAFAHLERTTREGNYTIQSGFFGTGPINPMLSKGGYSEAAQKTITQTAFPSWLYPVTQEQRQSGKDGIALHVRTDLVVTIP